MVQLLLCANDKQLGRFSHSLSIHSDFGSEVSQNGQLGTNAEYAISIVKSIILTM